MIFVYPWVLLFLPSLMLMGWLFLKFRKKVMIDFTILRKLAVHSETSSFWLPLMFGALVLLTFALARPSLHVKDETEINVQEMGTLVIALDISKSMLARDVTPSRLHYSKMAIEKIIEKIDGFKIALVAFSNDGFLVSPMSEDKSTLNFLLQYLDTSSMSSEGSSLLSALHSAKKAFASSKNVSKELLIVSDGADGLELKESIKEAQKENIRVHLLLVGTTQGAMIYDNKGVALKDSQGNLVITKRIDDLEKLALETGGSYVSSSGSFADLGWLAEQIRAKASKDRLQKESKKPLIELFYYPLGGALILLFFTFYGLHVKRFTTVFLLILWVSITPSYSGVLDFLTIKEANEAYSKGLYDEASKLFESIHASKQQDASAYNFANALYKTKAYEKAIPLYEGIKEPSLQFEKWHNMGNSYAKLHKVDEAISAYEKALALKEDGDTRYNLELLKKKNEQQKQEEKDKNSEKKESNEEQKDDNQQNQSSSTASQNASSKESSSHDPSSNEKEQQSSQPQMTEQEAKKWERMLQNREPTTKPMPLYKGDKMENKHAITW